MRQEDDSPAPPVRALRDDVRDEVARGAETADYFSTRPTADLQAVLRETPTRPLSSLLNTGTVSIDFEKRRIFRDVFWKGSFAEDTLLGWEERIRTSILGAVGVRTGAIYAGGSFWKRFDRIDNGIATGHVVNYEVAALPGKPVVEEIAYPDGERQYFRKGERVLLLRYTNEPYRIVYDAIKVIDDRNAIGVMHLGRFPRGMEFATFVMARHNYPFELMSIEDHRLVFDHPRAVVPDGEQLAGEWRGRLILLPRAGSILLRKVNPVAFHLSCRHAEGGVEGHYRFEMAVGDDRDVSAGRVRTITPADAQRDLRLVTADTMIGRWPVADMPPVDGLTQFVESQPDGFACYVVLSRRAT